MTWTAHIPDEPFIHFKDKSPTTFDETMKVVRDVANRYMAKARRGELSMKAAQSFIDGTAALEDAHLVVHGDISQICRHHMRGIYTSNVSWAVFTSEWIEAMTQVLGHLSQGTRVLEVCAGNGILTGPMTKRGFEWIATDIEPWGTADYKPIKSGALDAVKAYKPDVVFWSWWPYIMPEGRYGDEGEPIDKPQPLHEDHHLVKHCWENSIPIVFVGESSGGCTGSESLWGGPWSIQSLSYSDPLSLPGEFPDVPNWDGIHDSTFVIQPK
jgi:hypothetical protein